MKKGLSAIIAAATLMVVNNASASSSSTSISSIKNHILGTQITISSDLDTNNNSKVDMFDLIRYKQQLLQEKLVITTAETAVPVSTTTVLPPVTSIPPVTTTQTAVTSTNATTTQTPAVTEPQKTVYTPPAVHKIYITKTGKKYHYDNTCNGGTYFETTLEEALRRGLTPCNKCVHD